MKTKPVENRSNRPADIMIGASFRCDNPCFECEALEAWKKFCSLVTNRPKELNRSVLRISSRALAASSSSGACPPSGAVTFCLGSTTSVLYPLFIAISSFIQDGKSRACQLLLDLRSRVRPVHRNREPAAWKPPNRPSERQGRVAWKKPCLGEVLR